MRDEAEDPPYGDGTQGRVKREPRAISAWPIASVLALALLGWTAMDRDAYRRRGLGVPPPPVFHVRDPSGVVVMRDPEVESWDGISRALTTPGFSVIECLLVTRFGFWPPRAEWFERREAWVEAHVLSGAWSPEDTAAVLEEALPRLGADARYRAGRVVVEHRVGWRRLAAHLSAVALVPAVVVLPVVSIRSTRRAMRVARGQCPRCGYAWNGLERCPECGQAGEDR